MKNEQKNNAKVSVKKNGYFTNLYMVLELVNGEKIDCEIRLSPRDKKCVRKLLYKIEKNIGE